MTSTLSRPRAGIPSRAAGPPPRAWHRVALGVLLAGTAVLYLWNLSASGWGNAFYAAASQAGGVSWKAWFFGSSDAAGAITVDKAPGALWVSGLSVRIFGLSSWSVLAPQALMGVGSVGLLYACVRRAAGPGAALTAGAALALTPVAVLMFRYDNPDALLVLLLVGAAYATLRAVEHGRARWLVLVGVLVGFGFLAKMLQAFLVVPAFTLVWLAAAPVGRWRRLRGLGLAAVALVVSAGWWVAVVSLWPASDRPFIGGSQTNSVLELVFGYNGFGRITGDEVGSVGTRWGQTGLFRLFGSEMGAEASWLLPAALLLLGALLGWTRRRPRTDPLRAQALLWGGWLLVTGLTFSFMAGIIHPYYLVAIAPATAALVGLGTATLWRDRSRLVARLLLALAVVVTAGWSFALLSDASEWLPWLRWAVLGVGLVAGGALTGVHRMPRALAVGVATAALLAGGGGSAAWAVATARAAHSGAIPSSGPSGYGTGPDGRGGPGGAGGFRGGMPPGGFGGPGGGPPGTTGGSGTGTTGTGTTGTGTGSTGTGTGTGTGSTGSTGTGTGTGSTGTGTGSTGSAGGSPAAAGAGGGTSGATGAGRGPGQQGGRGGGGPGGILSSPTPSAAVTALISADGAEYTWAAAAVTSNQAAGYQLATRLPVLAVGGFNGTDPYPTLAQFRQMVADGRIHWFVGSSGGGGFGGPGGGGTTDSGGSDAARQIAAWVAATHPSRTVDGVTLYDLTAA